MSDLGGRLGLAAMSLGGMAYFGWLLYRGRTTGVIDGAKNGISLRRSEHPISFRITAWLYVLLIAMMGALFVMAVFDLQFG